MWKSNRERFAMFLKGRLLRSDVPPTPLAGTKIAAKDEEVMLKSNEGTVPPSQILRKEPGSLMSVMPGKRNVGNFC